MTLLLGFSWTGSELCWTVAGSESLAEPKYGIAAPSGSLCGSGPGSSRVRVCHLLLPFETATDVGIDVMQKPASHAPGSPDRMRKETEFFGAIGDQSNGIGEFETADVLAVDERIDFGDEFGADAGVANAMRRLVQRDEGRYAHRMGLLGLALERRGNQPFWRTADLRTK